MKRYEKKGDYGDEKLSEAGRSAKHMWLLI